MYNTRYVRDSQDEEAMVDIHYREVQWDGGAVDGGSIIQ